MANTKREKHKANLRMAVFFLMLLVPFILFLPQTGYLDLQIIHIEKRTPTPLPTLATTPLREFPAALENYISDRIPYRHEMIRLQAAVNLKVFGTVESTKVMLGRDRWLFSRNQPPANNQWDFQGIDHFTPDETAAIRAQLETLAARYAAEGREFVLLIGPNKEGVSIAHMPPSVRVLNEESRADALVQSLQGIEGLHVVWPKDELAAATEFTTYYKYDTHWNHLGAYMASRRMFAAVGIQTPPLAELAIRPNTESVPVDLANQSGIYPFANDDVSWTVDYNTHIRAPGEIGNEGFVSSAEDPRYILVMRDSFATMMMPFIQRTFAQGQYLDAALATAADVNAANADIIVLELVERNLHLLPTILSNLIG